MIVYNFYHIGRLRLIGLKIALILLDLDAKYKKYKKNARMI